MRKDGQHLSLQLLLGSHSCEVLLAQAMIIEDDDMQYNIYRVTDSLTDLNTSYPTVRCRRQSATCAINGCLICLNVSDLRIINSISREDLKY